MTDPHMQPTTQATRPPAAGSLVRSGLMWFGNRSRTTAPEIEPLVRALRANHPKADVGLIERAYATAELHHRGQMRKSGEPYITHPVAVATILAEMGMTTPTLVAALLHDTVEDTDYTVEELTADFGEVIAQLVDGVTKLDKVRYGSAAQSETLRKMVVAMSHDIRVLLIKLGDRLHNARTWRFVSADSAKRKAQETLEIYAPLAHRLGMNMIKWELEELSFKTLYPEIYEEIDRLVHERTPQREIYLREVITQIEGDLRHSGTQGTVTGRPKNHYSIYQKMIVRGKAFDEIYDLVAVRVLVHSVKDCYALLGALHGHWNPIPGRFKDYIAMPKFNLYQSLHTTVVGPGGKPVEIQIRTYEMHERAEHGVAAHWKYKQNPNATSGDTDRMSATEQMNWMRALVEMERETGDPEEFLDALRYEIAGDEVYVFTPKGEVIVLPAGATPIDFAYAVHTEVGHHTVGAKVNGRLVPLESRLQSGETVEVVTSKSDKVGPSRDWLVFVASPRARSKIKAWFSKERREEAVETGKEHLARAMRKQNLPLQRLMNHESLLSVANALGLLDITALYASIGENHISAQNVVSKLVDNLGGDDGTEETLAEAVIPSAAKVRAHISSTSGVSVRGMNSNEIWVKLAKCCTPVPGDEIVGFVTRGQGVSVHCASCVNSVQLMKNQPERFTDVAWDTERQGVQYLVQIETRALDRPGLLSDLTKVLSDHRVNILTASTVTSPDQVASARFAFELADMAHLKAVLAALRRVDGVFEAQRLTSPATRRHQISNI
ncbi:MULTISPECIES: RelA/SpoT family protein [unclassified Schaalia]|uniref:RelA/SpoT family protein n=1 Tax=unclassified Schaalia TaxID=2691889 RepID=UPI001E44373B|nr:MULTISPECIES: bifunctional (p)ppGpp synthetase/guanosine-3',5'-bis(diphosphate) 3'-pyrophosphohydrolase [unclassified Schaalia]MCD4550192.1 bifunctional (p)ppGpp synthetase/guanosine-3',5'-bis(diphosphate) 3'-pyrophosphohydrolase [Schaalia sp. lx-260]MCD4557388.1 bifunctional (p)ppGpp synthetase/guanosine-3',5'-bis(diphosphate) 3'-pyrophosphohydrolase [Schaalia sp. lx-100]